MILKRIRRKKVNLKGIKTKNIKRSKVILNLKIFKKKKRKQVLTPTFPHFNKNKIVNPDNLISENTEFLE